MSQFKPTQRSIRNFTVAAGAFISATTMLNPAASYGATLPTGGVAVGGSITFGSNSLTQTSTRGIAEFSSFNIGVNDTYNVNNGAGATLIRDLQSGRSNILGTLNATGNVMLVNGNGIFFGNRSQVNVNSLVATTSDIDNADFMAGSNHFNKSKNTAATVENRGTITAGLGGTVALIANGGVNNSGIITAQAGNIHLAAADRFVVDFDGDGIINFAVSNKMENAMAGQDAVVRNTGTLRAERGLVAMTASTANSVIKGVINTSGIVQATQATTRNGKIILSGGGTAKLSGTMNAKNLDLDVKVTSNSANGNGEVADRVNILSDRAARIDDAIDLVTAGGTVNFADGIYKQDGTLFINKSLTLKGESRTGAVIDSSRVRGNAIEVGASDVTLERFTLLGGGSNGISVAPVERRPIFGRSASVSSVDNFTLRNAVLEGAADNQLVLTKTHNALIENVRAKGNDSEGYGFMVRGSENVVLDNIATDGRNGAGGVFVTTEVPGSFFDVLFGRNHASTSVEVLNAEDVRESNPLITRAKNVEMLNLYAPEFGYAVRNDTFKGSSSDQYTFYQRNEADGIATALGFGFLNNLTSTLQRVTHDAVNQVSTPDDSNFIVGAGMRIAPALHDVADGGLVSVRAGTFDGGFIIDRSVTLAGDGAGSTFITSNPVTSFLSQTYFGRLLGIGSGVIEVDASPKGQVNLRDFTLQGAAGHYNPIGIHLASGDLLLNNLVLDGQGNGGVGIYQEPRYSFLTTVDTEINNYDTGLSVFSYSKQPGDDIGDERIAQGSFEEPVDRISALLSLGTSFSGNTLDIQMDAEGFITDARLAQFKDASSIRNIRSERTRELAGVILLPEAGQDDDIITRTLINRIREILKSGSTLGGDINLDALIAPAAGAGDPTEEQIRGELNRRLAIILQNYLDSGVVEDADDAIRSLLLRSI